MHFSSQNFYAWGDEFPADVDATAYMLWDKDFLYVAVDVKDPTPTNIGKGADWMNDAAELWFMDEGLKYKFHAAGDGNFFLGSDGSGKTPYNSSSITHVAVQGEGGYVIEFALPLNNLEAGREFGMTMQMNDISDNSAASGYAAGSQQADVVFTCLGEETETVEDTTVEDTETNIDKIDQTKESKAPIVVIIVIFVVVVGAGVVVYKKKKA